MWTIRFVVLSLCSCSVIHTLKIECTHSSTLSHSIVHVICKLSGINPHKTMDKWNLQIKDTGTVVSFLSFVRRLFSWEMQMLQCLV